jgi:predicted kinase
VQCVAPAPVAAERARRREDDPSRISDATPAIAARQLAEFEPLDEVPPRAHFTLRTDRPVEERLAELEAWLDLRAIRDAVG